MRTVLAILCLSIACGCTGTRTGNPGNNDDKKGFEPLALVSAKSDLERDSSPEAEPDALETFGRDNREFAFSLYRELSKNSGNLFFSPYSVSSALAMTYAGARGETETQMASALHFTLPQAELHAAFNATDLALAKRKDEVIESTQGDGFELSLTNQAWGQTGYEFLEEYLDTLALNYGAGMLLLDFAAEPERARKTINAWIERETEGRVKDTVPPGFIQPLTRFALVNAIYFKASWAHEFDSKLTKSEPFMAESGQLSVQMMHARWALPYAEVDGYQAISLKYLTPTVHMIAVLPPEGMLEETAANFDAALLEKLRAKLSTHEVTLSLPKWSFEWGTESLKVPLGTLGMVDAFNFGAADFSGMNGGRDLFIHHVLHKSFVAVDEEGTEAAAATVVLGGTGSAPPTPPKVTLTFNRPFMFLIYDEPTGQILFIGNVAEP